MSGSHGRGGGDDEPQPSYRPAPVGRLPPRRVGPATRLHRAAGLSASRRTRLSAPPGGSGYPPPAGGPATRRQVVTRPAGMATPYGGQPGGAGLSRRRLGQRAPRGWSGLAIASFVVAVVGGLCGIGLLVGVPLAIVALVKIRKSGDRGKVPGDRRDRDRGGASGGVGGRDPWVVNSTAERNDAGEIVEGGLLEYEDVREGDLPRHRWARLTAPRSTRFDFQGVPCDESTTPRWQASSRLKARATRVSPRSRSRRGRAVPR